MRTALIVIALTGLSLVPIFSIQAQDLVIGCPKDKAPDCGFEDFVKTINGLIDFLITLAASVAAILFFYAGWLYMTANGNSGNIDKGKKIFTSVAVGFGILLAAWLIVKFILDGLLKEGSDLKNVLIQ